MPRSATQPTPVLAVCNLKGGVGKTTVTFQIGAALARAGHRVLLIDADPHGTLSSCLGMPELGQQTLADVLRGRTTVVGAARESAIPGLWALPASAALDDINERRLAGERVLMARLPEFPKAITLIDCPASPSTVLLNALVAADGIICPTQPHRSSRQGIERLLAVVESIRRRGANRELDLVGVLVNDVDARTRQARRRVRELREGYGGLVFQGLVHRSVRVSEAMESGTTLERFAPGSRPAREIEAAARETLTRAAARVGYFGLRSQERERARLAVVGGTDTVAADTD